MTYNNITKAERLKLASEIVLESNKEFASELAQTLLEEAERVEKANARNRGKKRVSKAQKERAEVVEQVAQTLVSEQEKVFYDSVGLVKVIDLDYTPQRAIHVAKDLVEQNVIVEVGEQTFGNDKKRKAYALPGTDISELEPYDKE